MILGTVYVQKSYPAWKLNPSTINPGKASLSFISHKMQPTVYMRQKTESPLEG